MSKKYFKKQFKDVDKITGLDAEEFKIKPGKAKATGTIDSDFLGFDADFTIKIKGDEDDKSQKFIVKIKNEDAYAKLGLSIDDNSLFDQSGESWLSSFNSLSVSEDYQGFVDFWESLPGAGDAYLRASGNGQFINVT